MKIFPIFFLLLLASCVSEKKQTGGSASEDAAIIEREIANFHQALKRAYNGAALRTRQLDG